VTASQDSPVLDRASLIASLLLDELIGTEDGHCARVDFLDREEACAIARLLGQSPLGLSGGLAAYVLHAADDAETGGANAALLIAADDAVERRNRKRGRL